MRTKRSKGNKSKKLTLLISIIAIMILAVTAGTTIAWLNDKTDPVVNTFTPAKVTSQVEESVDNNIKSKVKIKNTSNIDAYIRAKVVVNWADKDGNVAGQTPVKDTDYEIKYNLSGSGWWLGDDECYYYSSAVAPDKLTDVLIKRCELKDGATVPDGYYLSVEIIADAIQSVPTSVVADNWNVTVDANGVISAPSGSGN